MIQGGVRRPGVVGQATTLVLSGCVLGIALDLLLPQGVLGRAPAVLRDLELLMPVHLWTPAEVQAALAKGETVLIDGREQVLSARSSPRGALVLPQEDLDDVPLAVLERLAGKDLVVMLGEDEFEDARFYAQELASNVGARGTGTLLGGFEAWVRAGLPTTAGAAP